MKKVSLLGFILAATSAHLASANAEGVVAAQPGCPKAFQGFHLGGNIGVGFINGKQRFRHATRQTSGAFVSDHTINHRVGGSGVDGGIGVGYTHRLCNWALGIAFDANWTNASGKFSDSRPNDVPTENVNLKARLRNSLQLYARLGYVMREIAMPFIGLGWDNSQWKQNARNAYGVDNRPTPSLAAFNERTNKSKRFNAFLWKVGVDFLATKHVVVGFEYTGTVAGSKSFGRNFTRPTSSLSQVDRVSGSFKPQYNKFALTAKIVY